MIQSEQDSLHQLVAESFARYGRESYAFAERHGFLGCDIGYSALAWEAYAEMGWLGMRLPESLGGMNADAHTIGSLMEMVGRHLMLEPLLAHAVLGIGALLRGDPDLLEDLAPALVDGTLKLAVATDGDVLVRGTRLHGEAVGVLHGDVADRLVVAIGGDVPALYMMDMNEEGVTRRGYRMVDGRGAAVVKFEGVPARRIGDGNARKNLLHEATVALCAEALGSVDQLIETTSAYLKVRKQFGRTLSSYQALQHRMSELVLLRDETRALTRAAEKALSQPEPTRSRIVSGAAAYLIGAARLIGNEAVQLHGGIGVTEELDVSHHFRRLMTITALLGGRDIHIERFAKTCRVCEKTSEGS